MPIRELPVIQQRIVRACARAGKSVIVVTHVLKSMIKHPLPTRAEVTDVANAIYEQADALMLSGAGAVEHPVRCVQVLDDIARHIEKEPVLEFSDERRAETPREDLALAAVRLPDSLQSRAIVVLTHRGRLTELVAGYRAKTAIVYAFHHEQCAHKALAPPEVVPRMTRLSRDPERTIAHAFRRFKQRNRALVGDPIVVVSDVPAGAHKVSSVQVRSSNERFKSAKGTAVTWHSPIESNKSSPGTPPTTPAR